MDFTQKLEYEISIHNDLVAEESEAEKKLLEIRERRAMSLGRIQMIRSLQEDDLKEASIAAKQNGRSNTSLKDSVTEQA